MGSNLAAVCVSIWSPRLFPQCVGFGLDMRQGADLKAGREGRKGTIVVPRAALDLVKFSSAISDEAGRALWSKKLAAKGDE